MAAPRSVGGADVPRPTKLLPLARTRERLIAVPTWAWLVAVISVSFAIRFALSLRLHAPWLFPDEVIYAELGRSFGDTGHFEIAGVANRGFGVVYPILIAPAYAIFDNQVDAYTAVKAINALVISLAAVPTYLIARRFLQPPAALFAAALALVVPSMAYSSTVMTENAFYPLFMSAAYATVLVLERQSIPRQVGLIGVFGLTYLTRRQGVVLVPGLLSAIGLTAVLRAFGEPSGRRGRAFLASVAAFRIVWICLLLAVGAALALSVGRGRGFEELLGPYGSLASAEYSFRDAGRWFAYNLADLDVSTGIIPMAALGLILVVGLRARSVSPARLAFAATSLSLVVWIVLQAAVFAAGSTGVPRIEERYTFYVAPLLFIALLIWVKSRTDGPSWPTGCAALVACLLPGVLLNPEALNFTLVADSLGLWPVLKLTEIQFSFAEASILILLAVLVAGLLFLALPRRLRAVLPAVVLLYMAVASAHVYHRMEYLSGYFRGGGIGDNRTWIDDSTPTGSSVVSIWAASAPNVDWANEFFSARLKQAYSIGLFLDGLPRTPLSLDKRTGLLIGPNGRSLAAEYAASDVSYRLDGVLVAMDPATGARLYRTDGAVQVSEVISGLFGDRISAGSVAYTRLHCSGGTLVVDVTSTRLVPEGQTMVARDGRGNQVAQATVGPGAQVELSVPLRPIDGACDVALTILPTVIPATVLGNNDFREIGVRFDSLQYAP